MTNKKAEISGEIVLTLFRIAFLTIVLFSVVLLVKTFYVESISVKPVEATVLFERVLYGKEGVVWKDPDTQRVHPGIIDRAAFEEASKTNPNFLDKLFASYGENSPILAARLKLVYGEGKSLREYYHKEQYDRWEPRTLSTVTGGPASTSSFEKEAYVLVKEGDKLIPGTLFATIIA